MYYKTDEKGSITVITSSPLEGFKKANEEIVTSFNGQLVFKSVTETSEYKTQEKIYLAVRDKESRIVKIKKNLSDTDYKTLKFVDGALSEADYAPIHAQRQAWRNEIKMLEMEIAAMTTDSNI